MYEPSGSLSRFRYAAALLIAGLAVMLFGVAAVSAQGSKDIRVMIDEKVLELSTSPVIVEGYTLVPFRSLFEAMKMEVKWDAKDQSIIATTEGYALTMQVNKDQAVVNDELLKLQVAPQIMNDHTMVPIRFISESTGAMILWNPYGREIVIYSEAFITDNGFTKDEVAVIFDEELARIKAEYERELAEQAAKEPIKPVKVADVPAGSEEYKPAAPGAVKLDQLQGMYYGFRSDHTGSECGGMCWDLYTFLSGNRIVVGPPVQGGPETIDCSIDACHTYTVQDGSLVVSNGQTYQIARNAEGELLINDVRMEAVAPAPASLTLDRYYENHGFSGLIGISGSSTSWSSYFEFNADGTFESSRLMLGQVGSGIGPTTNSSASNETTGSYRIQGNTLTLAYQDGTTSHLLFFIHADADPQTYSDIQIGADWYYSE